ncbi:hypothetical protein QYM36_002357, partial [Artemia franciscana]
MPSGAHYYMGDGDNPGLESPGNKKTLFQWYRKGESVNNYLVDLKHLAETCDFDEFLSQAFQDRLVCGLVSSDMRKRILTENDLTLSRAIEITTSMEAAEFEAIIIKNGVASKIHKFTKANAIPENN